MVVRLKQQLVKTEIQERKRALEAGINVCFACIWPDKFFYGLIIDP